MPKQWMSVMLSQAGIQSNQAFIQILPLQIHLLDQFGFFHARFHSFSACSRAIAVDCLRVARTRLDHARRIFGESIDKILRCSHPPT
jgi:hypothetical protein